MSALILNLIALSLAASMNINDLGIDRLADQGLEIIQEDRGINVFLSDPTRYNFLCTDESRGDVLSASLTNEGTLRLTYSSFWPDGDHSGHLSGWYDSEKNNFVGEYKTNDGRFAGEINFSFNEKGEAFGTWDHGYGVIKISLKQGYDGK